MTRPNGGTMEDKDGLRGWDAEDARPVSPSRPPVRKSSVRGPSTPYLHSLYGVFGNVQLAVLWQQVDWLSEEYGDEEGWAFWSVSELARILGPRESTIRGWLDRLVKAGALECSEYKNDHGQHAWRPARAYLLEAKSAPLAARTALGFARNSRGRVSRISRTKAAPRQR